MPYKSLAQEGYFHANKAKLEHQGVDVNEWDAATKGKSLPEHAPGIPLGSDSSSSAPKRKLRG